MKCVCAEEKRLHVPGGGDQQEVRGDLLHLLPEGGGGRLSQGSEAIRGKLLHKQLIFILMCVTSRLTKCVCYLRWIENDCVDVSERVDTEPVFPGWIGNSKYLFQDRQLSWLSVSVAQNSIPSR